MVSIHSGYYFTTKVRGKSVLVFVPNALPVPLTGRAGDGFADRIHAAEATSARY